MLQHIRHDRILELKLARPPANAFNLELLTALNSALESAQDEGCEAVILSGAPGLFSGAFRYTARSKKRMKL